MVRRLLIAVVLLLAAAVASVEGSPSTTVIYVDAGSGPGGDGQSWLTAFQDLQDALSASSPGAEVRVAQGVYLPDAGTRDRTATFQLLNGVTLKGGFAGIAGADPDARDPALFPTFMSGDLQQDDGDDFLNNGDNCFYVLRATLVSDATVDGFRVVAGNTIGAPQGEGTGGAARLEDSTVSFVDCVFEGNTSTAIAADGSSLTLTRCVLTGNLGENGGAYTAKHTLLHAVECDFSNNVANDLGGAIWITNFSQNVTFESCTFHGNVCERDGGAVGLWKGQSGAGFGLFDSCVFTNNEAFGTIVNGRGGALEVDDANFALVDCVFDGNQSRQHGGGVYAKTLDGISISGCRFSNNTGMLESGGGVYMTGGEPHQIERCVFYGNSAAGFGGGLLITSSHEGQVLRHCTFFGNTAMGVGGGAFVGDEITVENSIFWMNTDASGATESAQLGAPGEGLVDYCCVQGLTGDLRGVGNIDEDPQFEDAPSGDLVFDSVLPASIRATRQARPTPTEPWRTWGRFRSTIAACPFSSAETSTWICR